jgi:hypothetical protein
MRTLTNINSTDDQAAAAVRPVALAERYARAR